jgi:S-adenosylmethionine decarboxylase
MGGREWIVEAHGCDAAALTDLGRLRSLFLRLVEDLSLHPVAAPTWHQFDGTGGITGLYLLAESHLACHTFPEYRTLCLNLFCCRPRPEWDFSSRLKSEFSATEVRVRCLDRPYES